MGKQEDEIQRKLIELEASIEEEQPKLLTAKESSTSAANQQTQTSPAESEEVMRADLHLLGGLALIVTGLLMLFTHIRVGTGMMTLFGLGTQGMGFLLLPLFIGIGMLFYNHKSRWAQIVTAGGCALVLFVVLSQLVISFPSVSLLGLIFMVIPLTAGCAYTAKGMNMHKAIKDKSKKVK